MREQTAIPLMREQAEWDNAVPPHSLSREEKIQQIAHHFRIILETLGLDLSSESLKNTPLRVAKMFVNELFTGLDPEQFPSPTFFSETYGASENPSQIICTTVSFISFCEHHFLPIDGKAYIAYRPQKKLIGLSKIPKIVQFFARRPQIQERLTEQIAHCLKELLETEDVAVLLRAKHYCVLARGVKDQANEMTTQVLYGAFAQDQRKSDFFHYVQHSLTQ